MTGHSSYILLDVLIGMYRPGYGGMVSVVFLCVSLSHDAEPKYKGLRNQGSTDYLNSVLQVLFMTKEFRDAVQRFVVFRSS